MRFQSGWVPTAWVETRESETAGAAMLRSFGKSGDLAHRLCA